MDLHHLRGRFALPRAGVGSRPSSTCAPFWFCPPACGRRGIEARPVDHWRGLPSRVREGGYTRPEFVAAAVLPSRMREEGRSVGQYQAPGGFALPHLEGRLTVGGA